MAGDRAKSAPLLSPDGVERWDTKQRQRLFATILREAGAPEGSVCYSFRHGYISQLANQGVGLHMIAENCGTSVGQIEANYAKFRADEFRAVVAATTDKRPTLRLVKTEEPRQDEHQDLLPAAA
jgi:integrase